MRKFSFVIAAGGSGSRMASSVRKQFMSLGEKPLWRWSADIAAKCTGIDEIVLILPADYDGEVDAPYPVKIARGGPERAISVLNGLHAASCGYVMVHDAARPFATQELFARLMDSTDENSGAVPVLPVSDALKRIDGENITCVDRSGLYITQTPQCFPRDKLIDAVKSCPLAKDEAEAWEKAGHVLRYVEGERLNFKVTQKEDMMIARALVERETRTGLGYDVHRLVPDRRLILGGVEIADSPLGLLGHSDADLLTHAVMDAILGGAGLRDIGTVFPASDECFRGADSMELLAVVLGMADASGWKVEYVDAVVQAQVPKLNRYFEEIAENFRRYFEFNVKFKSAETLDDSGAGLSMTCWACATLRRRVND
ncbi:MAG: 2-C-methyl-D-erythritol 4-phosphate cytidylyltransferase [Synergistaceae bacterium]|nr:2-C-methyl-D-erythritol 4-phosphate cytidylyltransferase [Synergistaceae bacterium]